MISRKQPDGLVRLVRLPCWSRWPSGSTRTGTVGVLDVAVAVGALLFELVGQTFR